jgi:hypothetical protein
VAEVKAFELDAGSKSKSKPEREKQIIDVEPSATVATTKMTVKIVVAEVKEYESDAGSDSESELEREKQIIDIEPSATITTTKLQPGEQDEP